VAKRKFRTYGIAYRVSDKTKSDIYGGGLLPLLNSGRVDLLDNQRLVTQLTSLERRTARGGRDSIDHAPGGHDDVANAAAGALLLALTSRGISVCDFLDDEDESVLDENEERPRRWIERMPWLGALN
jgi:hypothetical protein